MINASPLHYDTYTVTNTTGSPACFTVQLDAGTCVGGSYIFSVAYLESFNSNNLSQNYLADIGASPNPRGSYSFILPAGGRAVVVVHEVESGQSCPAYGISISTCACPLSFSDVLPADYFYTAVQYLYCHGAISGYSDNTFHPYNNTTRGQVTKIVMLGFGIPLDTTGGPHFSDVPQTHPFYQYIETANHNGVVSGYADGTFRPYNNVTRGQLSKIVVEAAIQVNQWTLLNPPSPTFTDVPGGSAFYTYVETAASRGVISGYADRTFRPGNNATRGQISKIVYLAVTSP